MANSAPETFTRMLHAIDAKDWDGVRAAFTDSVEIDYSSLFGAPAATTAADDLVSGWQSFASAFDATQHLTGPFLSEQTDGSHARVGTHVRAYHRIGGLPGGDVWTVVGHYDVRLSLIGTAWRISAITLTTYYQEGNTTIPEIARARMTASRDTP